MAEPKKLTPTQIDCLAQLDDKEYRFAGRHAVRSCENLERRGFAEGDMMLAERNYRTGISRFVRGYRRTKAGRKALDKMGLI